MSIKTIYDGDVLDVFKQASDILAKAVKHTLGPVGRNTAVCTNSDGVYQILNDGKTIVESLSSSDPVIAPAIHTLKQGCFETNRVAGDGTTSTLLLTNKLLTNSIAHMKSAKVSPITVRKELDECKELLVKIIDDTIKKPITEEDYENVASVALGGRQYATLVSNAFKFLGNGGKPVLKREDRRDVASDLSDGITLTKTKLAIDKFPNGKELYDCSIVCIYDKVDRFGDMLKLLTLILKDTTERAKNGQGPRKCIIFYNEFSYDVVENIFSNIQLGKIDVLPIRVGGYGIQTREVLTELAAYTGGALIDGVNRKLQESNADVIGSADYLFVSDDNVLIKGCKPEEEIKKVLGTELSLPLKSCIIRVGGNNIIEQEETFRRIEDAVSSLGSAIEDGITMGGGTAYIDAGEELISEECPEYIRDALSVIYRTIIYNMSGITEITDDQIGLFPKKADSRGHYEFADLDKTIFDSSLVIKEVIRNSFSLVGQIITTEQIISELVR